MKRSSSIAVNLEEIDGNSLEQSWKMIGAGGFSQVFKARHHQWRRDVAIKLFDSDESRAEEDAVREAELMRRAESPYVMRVLGVFKGSIPHSTFIHHGLVMEVMERGSLDSLQKELKHLLPWPLVFRLAHQVALGMDYLHSLTPALIHKGIKPGDILLDTGLNVKITDFGLSKFVNTTTSPHLIGACTPFFTPPEFFSDYDSDNSCAYDVYSYAILVWTLLNPDHCYKQLHVRPGERPSLEYVNRMNVPGLEELLDLMVRCWNEKPDRRPSSRECIAVTEGLYEKNKSGINDAVCQVLNELDGFLKDPQRVVTDYTTSRKEDVKDASYSDDDLYRFTSKTAGLCVIINNKDFGQNDAPRKGTDADAAELARTFTWLGFRVLMCKDKRKDQMLNILGSFSSLKSLPELQKSNVVEWSGSGQKFTDLKDLPRHGDAFVCCILSHGTSEGVRGTDGRTIPIRDIIRPFNSKTCPALLNKPKLFFIQACRGSGAQEGVNFVDLDGHVNTSDRHSYSVPEYADYFIGFSTIDQYAAARKDDGTGSWYIQTLCNQLKYGCPRGYDILRILTRVTDDVCKLAGKLRGGGDFKQSPDSMNTLRRLVVFRPI